MRPDKPGLYWVQVHERYEVVDVFMDDDGELYFFVKHIRSRVFSVAATSILIWGEAQVLHPFMHDCIAGRRT